MIPEIGVMVGLYIITRMLSLIIKRTEKGESALVIVFAALTIIATIFIIYDLFQRGANIQTILGQ